jgi:hypothetical protein
MKIISQSYEQCLDENPQGSNAIDFFRKRFLNHFSEDLNNRIWIAGGCVRDYFTDGYITKDVDFFCIDRKSMAELLIELRNKFQFKHYLMTRNAIKGYGVVFGKRIDIDIVKKPFANPLLCIDAFDFTVCCFGLSFGSFFYHPSAAFDLLKRKLVVHALPHPVDSMKRMNKYTKKGFTACNGTILTIAKAINELDASKANDIFEFYKFD